MKSLGEQPVLVGTPAGGVAKNGAKRGINDLGEFVEAPGGQAGKSRNG
jgi:hypothetical protein